jgi:hypothetical protein
MLVINLLETLSPYINETDAYESLDHSFVNLLISCRNYLSTSSTACFPCFLVKTPTIRISNRLVQETSI